uniref:ShKT domain-containing protein n=1 Tax=Panagrolaimus sp. JU765 TaxID=591449 RepID=A0AC34Q0A3_9BILA
MKTVAIIVVLGFILGAESACPAPATLCFSDTDCFPGLVCTANICCEPSGGLDCLDTATNCASMAASCDNPSYIDILGKQCGLTCKRCTCSDIASNCAANAALCSDSRYYTTMTQQCPKTCRRCGVVVAPAPAPPVSTCVDKVNPKTGVSDCPARASYCNNSVYYKLMTEQCPKTCGRCPSG